MGRVKVRSPKLSKLFFPEWQDIFRNEKSGEALVWVGLWLGLELRLGLDSEISRASLGNSASVKIYFS